MRRDPRSRTATGTTSSGSPTSRRRAAPRSTWRRTSALCSSGSTVRPAGVASAPYTPDVLLAGDETVELAGITFESSACPATRPGTSPTTPTAALFSGDVLFAGSVGRTDLPGADWETLLESIRTLTDRSRPTRSSTPATARRRRSAPSSRESVPRGAARVTRALRGAAGTHDVLPPSSRCGGGSRTRWSGLPLYGYRRIETPGVRGHRAVRPDIRRRLGRRAEGDVHVRGPRRTGR